MNVLAFLKQFIHNLSNLAVLCGCKGSLKDLALMTKIYNINILIYLILPALIQERNMFPN